MNKKGIKFVATLLLAVVLVFQGSVSSFAAEMPSFMKTEGNVSQSRMDHILANYVRIPEEVRHRIENEGWTFICSSEDFGADNGYSYSLLALTIYGTKTIYIDDRTKAEPSIIHEVGHIIDNTFGFCSESQEFTNIFNTEHGNVSKFWKTHHNNTDTRIEYFAESFLIYVMQPEDLQTYCPQTYDYITNVISIFPEYTKPAKNTTK